MLVLSRQRGQSVIIGDEIRINVSDIRGDKVRLGIAAPPHVRIHRQEVYDQIKKANLESSNLTPDGDSVAAASGPAREFIHANDESRDQLSAFISRLSPGDFERRLGGDWTIATLLCHLAFWDQRAAYLLRLAKTKPLETIPLTGQAVDSFNHALRFLTAATPGNRSADLALQSARDADAEAAAVSDEVLTQIKAARFDWLVDRSVHRLKHLQRMTEIVE